MTAQHIGAGTGPAGPAIARPFLCIRLLCGLVLRLNSAVVKSGRYVCKCARIRLAFSMAKLPGLRLSV